MILFIRGVAAILGKMQIFLKERASHILVFKMVLYIRKAAAMLGEMQIPLKERASCMLV